MNVGKIRALVLIIIATCLAIINWYMANLYREEAISIILVLVILFAYCPAIIASLYVLTDGWILRSFLGPMDYGYWDKPKR
jgi:hypothetical protein